MQELNIDQELKNIKLILDHNKAQRKRAFIWPQNGANKLDLILYRKLLRSFKRDKISVKFCYRQAGLELVHNTGQYFLLYQD